MAINASFEDQVAIWIDYYRDTITDATAARAARATIAAAVEGESVFIGSSSDGRSASAVVVRDKLAMMAALQQHIRYLAPTSAANTITRNIMVHGDHGAYHSRA